MIHPVFRLAAAQPMLVANHLGAYAELASEELTTSVNALRRRLLWLLVCTLCLSIAAVLAGVALLLWASLPTVGARALWVFMVTPLLPTVLGLLAWWRAGQHTSGSAFPLLRGQLTEDAGLLARHATP